MDIKYGFKLGKMKEKQLVVKRAFDAIAELLGKAVANPSPYFRGYWLGNAISTTNVRAYTQRIATFLNQVIVLVELGSPEGSGGGSFAFCDAEKYRGQQQFGTDYSRDWKPKCTIIVGPNFFSNEVSRGERAETLLHELTHLVLATTDEKVTLNGHEKDCYGGDYCRKLVLEDGSKAQRNAENWGYYLAAYHVLLGWPSGDEKYLTAYDSEQVRGKRFR